jgi:sporulation protein YlmC with PRC-barrel domain
MLWKASSITGYAIVASDGRVGTVSDFLFDDASWRVRWMVVDTGNWLSGRKVLLPPSVLGHRDSAARQFAVRLTTQQVKDSPDVDTERPVSRQTESGIYDYYGWAPYWGTGFYMGGYGYGVAGSPPPEPTEEEKEAADAQRESDDPHLRSIDAVTDYHIHATDGEIGHVEDFLVEDADWSIHYLIIDTKNWWPGERVLVSPHSAKEISWTDRLVRLDVDRQTIKASPAYDPSTTVDRAYERQFHTYYGAAETRPPLQR